MHPTLVFIMHNLLRSCPAGLLFAVHCLLFSRPALIDHYLVLLPGAGLDLMLLPVLTLSCRRGKYNIHIHIFHVENFNPLLIGCGARTLSRTAV